MLDVVLTRECGRDGWNGFVGHNCVTTISLFIHDFLDFQDVWNKKVLLTHVVCFCWREGMNELTVNKI